MRITCRVLNHWGGGGGVSGVGSKTQVLEVWKFGGCGNWGNIRISGGLLGYLQDRVLSFWARISYVSITDFTKLFWSGDAYF